MATEPNQTFQALCDLAARPEYLAPLREEAETFFARSKEEKSLTAKSMTMTPKLESFIKESLRLNPLELSMCPARPRTKIHCGADDHPVPIASMNRTVMKHIKLPDGSILKSGTQICVALLPASMNPDIFPSPGTFDGWRCLKFRTDRDGAVERSIGSQWDATSAQLHSLHWGYGNRTCPGRFLAVHMIKMLIAMIIVRYDIRNEVGEGVAGRPKNAILDVRVQPDDKARLGFRELKR